MAVKPKLAMLPSGYKASKVYSVLPSNGVGDFDFTRSGSATRINKDGLIETVSSNIPRLNYPMIDGVVSGCPSLLLESASTNLFPYSEDFTNADWGKASAGTGITPVVTSNQGISPDGTLNADRVQFDLNGGTASGDFSIISDTVTVTSGATTTKSIYLKSNDNSTYNCIIYDGSTADELEVIVTNEWQRFELTNSVPSTSSSIAIGLRNAFGVTGQSDTADLLVWGAQLEEQSYATSYIPTSGSTTTRSAETCNNSGDANTFNDSEGVLMFEASALSDDGGGKWIALSNGTTNERLSIALSGNDVRVYIKNTLNLIWDYSVSASVLNFNKIAIKFKSSDYALWINGIEIETSTNANIVANLNSLQFNSGAGVSNFYGNTKQLQYFDAALTDTDLEELTSWKSFNEMAQSQLYSIY